MVFSAKYLQLCQFQMIYVMVVYSHDLLGEVLGNRIKIISWHASERRLLCFYHPVTIYPLLRIRCVTVVDTTIFIMSLDIDAIVEHVLMQAG